MPKKGSKRITAKRVKKWASQSSGPLGVLLIGLIIFLGAGYIEGEIDYSPSCAGDNFSGDPCWMELRLCMEKDVFIYPDQGYSELMNTNGSLEDIRLLRKWGTGYREYDLTDTCKGTWCGAPRGVKEAAYSVALREGKCYDLRVEALKEDPEENILWSINPEGIWEGKKVSAVSTGQKKERAVTYPSEARKSGHKTVSLASPSYKVKNQPLGTYKVTRKTGNESFYDVRMTSKTIQEIENYTSFNGSFEQRIVNVSIQTVCFVADFQRKSYNETLPDGSKIKRTYHVPSNFTAYKNGEEQTGHELRRSFKKKIADEVKEGVFRRDRFQRGDTYEFCTDLDPRTDFHFKFGEATIELEQETSLTANVHLVNVTAEPQYTHLNISDPSVVFYTTFDKENNTHVHDYSKNNNDGTVNGVSIAYNETGYIGRSAYMDGTTDNVIEISDFDELGDDGSLSAFIWVNGASQTTKGVLAHYDSSGNQRSWQLRSGRSGSEDEIAIVISDNGGSSDLKEYESSITAFDSTWNSVAFAWNGTSQQLNLFVNGVNDTSVHKRSDNDITDIHDSTGVYDIGSTTSGGTPASIFTGSLDMAMIFNRTLGVDEIANLHNQTLPLFIQSGTQTFASFPLNLTDENVLNVSVEGYQRFNGTDIFLEVGDWNYTESYTCSSDPDLILCLPMDNRTENGENETFTIGLSQNNNATVQRGTPDTADGRFHTGFKFEETDQDAFLADVSQMDGLDRGTISAWVNYESFYGGNENMPISSRTAGGNRVYLSYPSGSNILIGLGSSGAIDTGVDTTEVPVGTWHMQTLTWDSGSYAWYLDGVQRDTGSYGSTVDMDNKIAIGGFDSGDTLGSGFEFDGSLDHVLIWNRSLSSDEVKDVYVNGFLNFTYNNYTRLTAIDGNDNSSFDEFTVRNSSTEFELKFNLTSNDNNSYSPSLGDANITLGFEFVPPPPLEAGAGKNITSEPLYHHLNITNENILFYMPFDGDNNTDAYDYTSYNEDGTVVSANTSSSGIISNSLGLDGSSGYVDILDSATGGHTFTDLGQNITVSAWINPVDTSATGSFWFGGETIIELRDEGSSSDVPFSMGTHDNKLSLGVATAGVSNFHRVTSTNNLTENEWQQVGFTISGNNYKLFINGVLNGSGTLTPTGDRAVNDTAANFQIGVRSRNSGQKDSNFFGGLIDEVIIFNSSLTESDMGNIYDFSLPKFSKSGELSYKSSPINVTTEDRINYTFEAYNRFNGTELKITHMWWNYTKGYNETPDELLAYYHFDNRTDLGENNTYFIDSSIYGNNLTASGEASFNATGRYHTGLGVDGVNDYASLSDGGDISLDLSDNFTISWWYKHGKHNGLYETMISKRVANTDTSNYQFYKHVTTNQLRYYNGIAEYEFDHVIGQDTDWTHLLLSMDTEGTDTLSLYVNGVFDSSVSASPGSVNNGDFWVGYFDHASQDEFFNGSIDDIRILNRSSTAEEAEEQYLIGNLLYLRNETQSFNASDANDNFSVNSFPLDPSTQEHHALITFESNNEQSYSPLTTIAQPVFTPFQGGGAPPADSCTYTSGAHTYLCEDNCNIAVTTDFNQNSVLVQGNGTFTGFKNLFNYSSFELVSLPQTQCHMHS